MTNKEAAAIVERIRYFMEGGECWTPTEFKAMDMAIEALSSCEDPILQGVYLSEKEIKQLPSVQLFEIASPDKIKDAKPKFYPEDWSEIL